MYRTPRDLSQPKAFLSAKEARDTADGMAP